MVTPLEKRIYNTYLIVSRTKNNQPFKVRQNFNKFEDEPHYISVKKLANFFERHQNVSINDFFLAPYDIYKNDIKQFYDIKFYLSAKARSIYTMYMKKKDKESPDSETAIKRCKDSMLYIYKYCMKRKINIDKYLFEKSSGQFPDFIIHLKDRKVDIYTLFAIDGFERKFFESPQDLLAFMFGDLYNDFTKFRMAYLRSENCKRVCKSGLNEIKNIIEKKLKR